MFVLTSFSYSSLMVSHVLTMWGKQDVIVYETVEIKHGHEHKVKIVISQLTLVRLVWWRVRGYSIPVLAFPTERLKHIKPSFPHEYKNTLPGFREYVMKQCL